MGGHLNQIHQYLLCPNYNRSFSLPKIDLPYQSSNVFAIYLANINPHRFSYLNIAF